MDPLVELARADSDVFFRLYYDEGRDFFRAQWIGTLSQEDMQWACHKALNVFLKHDCGLFLMDHSKCQTHWQDVCGWARILWTPKAIGAQLRYFGHWVPSEKLSEPAKPSHDLIHGSVCMLFNEEKGAIQWLQEKTKKTLA